MSRKTELQADLQRVGFQLGGAHLTRQARSATFNTFARVMRELGYGIKAAGQIGGRHLAAFASHRATHGISSRTCANELGHLRAVLVQIGKQGLARNTAYSNQALGIDRGSRVGTKQPLSDAAIVAFQEKMVQLGRPSIGAILELQRALGLREAEAIRASQMETLTRWQRELQEQGSVRVIEGTKGRRPREVHPADLGRAQIAVQHARTVLETSGQRYLVTRSDGSATTGLRQTLGVYRNLCNRAGIQSHGARYAFARERMQGYRDQGYSEREARAATSLDLGHGDGRGRYIVSVYARGA
ncbi:MAG: integrase domain-containing protein [Steroidobacteraceae bacterium]